MRLGFVLVGGLGGLVAACVGAVAVDQLAPPATKDVADAAPEASIAAAAPEASIDAGPRSLVGELDPDFPVREVRCEATSTERMALGLAEDDSIRVTLYGGSTTVTPFPCALRYSPSGVQEGTTYRFAEAVLGLPEGGTAFGGDRGGNLGITVSNSAGATTAAASAPVPLDNALRSGARLLREPSGDFILAASRVARFAPTGLLLGQTALPGEGFSSGAELDGPGRILAHAATDAGLRVHAFRTDLGLDTSFGDAGSVEVDGTDFVGPSAPFIRDVPSLAHTSIALTGDGRIYVTALAPTPRVFRLLPSGALDPAFGTGGRIDLPEAGTPRGGAVASVVDREGRLLVLWGAAEGYVTRLGLDGRPDPTFAAGGFLRAPQFQIPKWPGVWGAAWQSDGRLVVLVGQSLLRIR